MAGTPDVARAGGLVSGFELDPGRRKARLINARTSLAVADAEVARQTARSRALLGHLVANWGLAATVDGLVGEGMPPAKVREVCLNAGLNATDVDLALQRGTAPK